MRGYLIDPFTRRIEEVDHDGSLESIYEKIQADCFTLAEFDDKGNCAYVDDEGLFKQGQQFFLIDTYPQPLAGRGLILAHDEEGETVGTTLTVAEVFRKIRFMTPTEVKIWAKLNQ